jgi:Xaa-Pro aminopeptidase
MTRAPYIGADEIRTRQEACRRAARDRGLDGLVVVGNAFYDRPGDCAYLSGHYPPFPSSNFNGDYRGLGFAVFILPVSGMSVLVTDTEAYRAERLAADLIRPARNLPSAVRTALSEVGLAGSRVGFVGLEVAPWALVNEIASGLIEVEPADRIVREARRTKSRAEIALLKDAAMVAEAGMEAALGALRPGVTEADICAEGVGAGLAAGADFIRYLRVHSGPFSGWPHRWPPATDRVLKEGETVCMDYIGAVGGYQFDILRTGIVGEPTKETAALVALAEETTRAALRTCGPGVPVRAVIEASDAVIERGGFLQHRAKFTGHGIGLDTVEEPYLMAGSEEVLRAGDVLCLEPGILIRDVMGARFEYEVVITDSGTEILGGAMPYQRLP